MMADNPVPPSWFDDRDINYAEVAKVTEVPTDTVRGWHRLLIASGADVGVKFRKDWHFSTRELVAFCMVASLRQLGYPIGLQVLRDIDVYVRAHDNPERPFTIGFEGCPAIVMIDARMIYEAVVEVMTAVRSSNA